MARGHQRERALAARLRAEGWVVVRATGSLGCADLVALRAGHVPRLIEVKSTAQSPYERFGPREREELREAAARAGAEAWLVWWPPRRGPVWLGVGDWPRS